MPREQTPQFIARFESFEQIPQKYADRFEYIIVPIEHIGNPLATEYADKLVWELTITKRKNKEA